MPPKETKGSPATAVCHRRNRDRSKCRRNAASGTRYCWQHTHGLRAKLRALPRNASLVFGLAILGAVVGILALLVPLVARFVADPKVEVVITGLRVTKGNALGCVVYSVEMAAPQNETIDGVYFTIQFPANIAGYRFGTGSASELGPPAGRMSMAVFEVGKDPTGECQVVQAAIAPSPDLTATIAGPGMVQVRGTRILPKTMVYGLFALSVRKPSFQPAQMFTDGSYEYKRLGFTVSKPLKFVNQGIHETK